MFVHISFFIHSILSIFIFVFLLLWTITSLFCLFFLSLLSFHIFPTQRGVWKKHYSFRKFCLGLGGSNDSCPVVPMTVVLSLHFDVMTSYYNVFYFSQQLKSVATDTKGFLFFTTSRNSFWRSFFVTYDF